MNNEQMKPGRFLKLQNGRRTFARITTPLKAGKRIVLATMTRATQYDPKHLNLFTMAPNGDVFVQRGKRRDCLTSSGQLLCGFGVEK